MGQLRSGLALTALALAVMGDAGPAAHAAASTADIVRFLEQATCGPTPELIEHVRRSASRFLDEQFDAPMSSYPTLPLDPTTRDTVACPNGSACQRDNYTHYPLQNRFFPERALRPGPAAPAGRVRAAPDHRRLRRRDHQPSWMAPYLQILDRNAFGNYRAAALRDHAQPGDGQLPRHDRQHAHAARTRTTRARSSSSSRSARFRLNPDGTPQLDEAGQPIPTYSQDESTTSRACSPAGGWRRAPAPACRTTSTRWCPTRPSTMSAPRRC